MLEHQLVIVGEIHHRPTYWQLNSDLVADPKFPQMAGAIYLELPMNDQVLVDQFLAASQLDVAPIIAMLRDMMTDGWPDQPTVDFFTAVWKANQALANDQRIRIALVDMARPWKDWQTRADVMAGDADRDEVMAQNILSDRQRHRSDPRGALFICGFTHAEQNLKFRVDPTQVQLSAGQRLKQAMGDTVYSILQHVPQTRNTAPPIGRAADGLFDAVFEATSHAPVAFPLARSPFGTLPFDADADRWPMTQATFAEAFDGYLYLHPLEEERFAPLIENFFDEDIIREINRRREMLGEDPVTQDAASFAADYAQTWGQPRRWGRYLGPIDGWRRN
jgi:hypothetical protein